MSNAVDNATAQANLRRVVISSLMGAVIEWYDFFLYGVVAGLVFNKLFFPSFSSGVGTILAFATFAVGFVAPLLRSVLFGMPPMYPIAIAMAFELATYGAVAGFMYRKVQHTLPMIYATLVTSMVAGRLVWGAVRFVLAGLSGSSFPFSAFLSGAVLTAVPGIVAQLILIPLIVAALQKARLTA